MKDATGAGDAFIGAVIAQILNGERMERLWNGKFSGEYCSFNSANRIPAWDEVLRIIKWIYRLT